MMREKTIEKVIKELIAKELTISPNSITPETNLLNDLNADSMNIVNILTSIESKFKIIFPNTSAIKYEAYTVGYLIQGTISVLKSKEGERKRTRSPKSTPLA